jgi:hypothetical protein
VWWWIHNNKSQIGATIAAVSAHALLILRRVIPMNGCLLPFRCLKWIDSPLSTIADFGLLKLRGIGKYFTFGFPTP